MQRLKSPTTDQLLKEIASLGSTSFNDNDHLIIYIKTVVARQDNKTYLATRNAVPEDHNTWLSLDELRKALDPLEVNNLLLVVDGF